MATLKLGSAALAAGVAWSLCGAGAASAAEPIGTSGAPKAAEVKLSSTLAIPPEAFALVCTNLPDCTSGGKVDLGTAATVQVSYQPDSDSSRGVGPLAYGFTEGAVNRTLSCQGSSDPYVSSMKPIEAIAGELEVSAVRAVPGENTIEVLLNPGGDSGDEFPEEIYERSDGGCGAPGQKADLTGSYWHYNFFFAHRGEGQEAGDDLELEGLAWDGDAGLFAKEYDRFVDVPFGASSYKVHERTRIEVKPEFCPGRLNRITSATFRGEVLGLDRMPFYVGQVITAPEGALFRLADGSTLKLASGGSWKIERCHEDGSVFSLTRSVKRFWVQVKKTLSGSEAKFKVRTDRAVAGVRGTTYALSYDKRRQLTRVAVKEGSVSLKGINGAKGKIVIKAGQVGVQKGKGRPRIVKR